MKSSLYLALAVLMVVSSAVPVAAVPVDSESSFSCNSVTEIPQIECEALVALYNSTRGYEWLDSTNWLITNTPSTWYGITVTDWHVTNISLGYNRLIGTIPSELGSLSYLLELNLATNQLDGGIPPSLGNLSRLLYLYLSDNMLYGRIPPELGNLASLKELNLSWNSLYGSLPAEIGNLLSLTSLYVGRNEMLSGRLPASLTKLRLDHFYFNETSLCEPGDPDFQAWLGSIRDVYGTGVICPGQFVSCDTVVEIPPNECQALVSLYSSTNGPGWRYNSFWLESEQPSFWYGVTVTDGHVSKISLGSNQLIGYIPVDLGLLSNLTELQLSYNQLRGEIPVELENLSNLTILSLGYNHLTGYIPPQLGNLTNLTYLDLGFNQLRGTIPPSLGNLVNLKDLGLSYNQLRGNIPLELVTLVNLEQLGLSYNQLDGNIPPWLGTFIQLDQLGLSSNMLTGPIPPELGNLTGLMGLYLDRNQLSGSIPPSLGNLTAAWVLDLSNNQLSGSIPPELGYLGVWNLYLNDNQLNGNIPSTFGNLAAAWVIDLRNNHLSGSIPPSLGNLINLLGLDLSHNQLTGSIPAELGDLVGIDSLQLDDNRLEGEIPNSFIKLKWDCEPPQCNRTGFDFDYNFLNIPVGYPDPNDQLQVFLSQIDPDWHLYQGFEQVVGAAGGEIQSLDGRTDILIPEGAVITNTIFTYKPWSIPLQGMGSLSFGHNTFDLTAMDTYSNPITVFNSPITVTLSYTTTDLFGVPENTLAFYYWDEPSGSWKDAVTTCTGGAYQHDADENRLQLPLCHLTEFGLFGIPERIFLPDVWR